MGVAQQVLASAFSFTHSISRDLCTNGNEGSSGWTSSLNVDLKSDSDLASFQSFDHQKSHPNLPSA